MSKRDYMCEIKELQKRLPDAAYMIAGHQDAISELVHLYPSEKLTHPHAIAVTHYVAVRLVAVLQSAFRAVIRGVVDYNARHKKPLPKIEERITLDMVREFASNTVTLGDFVSHLLPLNSFGQMEHSFKLTAGTELQDVVSPHFASSIVKDASFQNVRRALIQLFEERNVICHEIRDNEVIEKETLGRWLVAVLLMVSALGLYETEFIEL